MSKQILVLIGSGGIGVAIARRLGTGKTILLADISQKSLDDALAAVQAAGHDAVTHRVDVTSRESVQALADAAGGMGDVMQVIHTAGLSPVQASPAKILQVDLLGTALVIEAFGKIIASGGSGLVISSMAGHMHNILPPLPLEQEQALGRTPTDELLRLPFLSAEAIPNSGVAYAMSKRANCLRVQYASVEWGDRGARLNSMSPGIILTPLAKEEMEGPGRERYQETIRTSAAGRVGTTDEIASAAAYLAEANFITGTDLLIDGGVIAAMRSGRL